MLEKILICLKILINESDYLTTICYRCAGSVEKHYEFVVQVKTLQSKINSLERSNRFETSNVNRRHVTSYVREEVIDADYTFSFLDVSKNEEKKEPKPSSPFFSYFSSPNLPKQSNDRCIWKTPRSCISDQKEIKSEETHKKCKKDKTKHHSRDLFESQSQDFEEPDSRSLDWKLTPDESLIKRVREKCFGRLDY
ncbi:hypothetical protein KGM_214477 [Danaus plexippus plexippus]|uniref:ZAD domain-containing protein n=1 Tax=Danaus plexippus plexippus TaxID=278856 RepID=A0A212FH10_DANPL|nr:hypothetical protein KGM_214477 [Danaus plexippus plexippus]